MSNNTKKDKNVQLKKEFLSWLGERDESIRQAFESFDKKVGQGFQGIEFKLGVIFALFEEMGVTPEKINEAAAKLQASVGGEQNEQAQTGPLTEEGVTDSQGEATGDANSNEGGDEHFS